jgi:hypothetical protein
MEQKASLEKENNIETGVNWWSKKVDWVYECMNWAEPVKMQCWSECQEVDDFIVIPSISPYKDALLRTCRVK